MQATVFQENFHKALSFVSKTVSTKTQLPVLSNILLEAGNGKLTLSATNLETSIVFWIGATVEKTGAITVPARLLTEIISSVSQEKINLSLEKNLLRVSAGTSEMTLSGIDAKEFPTLPSVGEKADMMLGREEFDRALSFVGIAASQDEGRPLLTGVRLVEKGKGIEMVATDGFRLSIKHLPKISGVGEGVIIPARSFSEVLRLAEEEKTENIEVFVNQERNQVVFLFPHAQLATRLIEGEYPAYQKIVPAAFLTTIAVGKEDLTKAVKLASIYAREAANIIKFNYEEKDLLVSASSAQLGENKTTVSVQKEGEGGEIAFNARFLLDLLAVFPEEEIAIELNGPLSPGVFKPTKDDSFLHIIMPVRV